MHGQFYVFICGVSVSHLIYWLFSRPPENSFAWAINTRFHTTAYGNIYTHLLQLVMRFFLIRLHVYSIFTKLKCVLFREIQAIDSHRQTGIHLTWKVISVKCDELLKAKINLLDKSMNVDLEFYERALKLVGCSIFLATLFRTSSI